MEPTSTEITLLSKIFANTKDTVHNKEDLDHLEDQNNLENLETLLNLQNLDDSSDLEDLADMPIRLDTLPIIVLRHIFELLDSEDRFNLGLVNNTTLDILHTLSSWSFTEQYSLQKIAANLKVIRRIDLSVPDPQGIYTLVRSHPELTCVHLNYCPDISDKELDLLLSLPLLQELEVSHADKKLTGSGLGMKEPRALRYLDLSGCNLITDSGLESILIKCRDLKSLKLRECVKLTNNVILKLSKLCPGLSLLDISLCIAVTGEGIASLASLDLNTLILQSLNFPVIQPGIIRISKQCLNLETIYFSCSLEVSPEDICHALSSCSALKHLFMSYCRSSEASSPWRLDLNCPLLRSLGLRGCNGLEETSIQSFSDKHKQLEFLDISRVNINDDQLIQIMSFNPGLQILNLSGCQSITDKSILCVPKLAPKLGEINLKGTRTTNHGILSLRTARFIRVVKCDHLLAETRQILLNECPRIHKIESFF